MPENKKLSQIKSSLVSRSLSLAKLGLNAGLKYAGTKIANTPFEDFLNSQAVEIAKEFGELKGSLMKAGQMLSMYGEYFLPPEANQVLKKTSVRFSSTGMGCDPRPFAVLSGT